jgi:beta-xylosidase
VLIYRIIFTYMKHLLSMLVTAIALQSAPLWAQSPADSYATENQTTIRILEGDNPDPSILRYNGSYYLLHSSFLYTPGLVVYQSDDLVNWHPCSAALNTFTGDIWAPDLVVYKDRFYIYFPTRNDEGKKTNMVTWADSPYGPWSTPVDLKVGGIDPEHVVGENGKRYLLMSSGALYPLADDGCSITGEPTVVYKEWQIPEEWDIEGVSMEGLNVKKVGEYYYLFAAEGGTAGPPTSHMVVQARSKSIFGPWENAPFNPLLRTESRAERWWSKGHGSIVDTADGRLFMIFHAYEKDYQTLGRQCLLRELEQRSDGWLHLKEGPISLPQPKRLQSSGIKDFVWQTCKERCLTDRFRVEEDRIVMQGNGATPKECSPLLARTSAHRYEVEACFELKGEHATAGLVAYYNDQYHFGFGFDRQQLLRYRRGQLNRAPSKCPEAQASGKLWLRLRDDEHVLSAWYSADGKEWHKYPWGFEISGVHHNTVYGFLFVRPGLFAGGEGEVVVTNFVLRNLDE